jgi:hypothetical protein
MTYDPAIKAAELHTTMQGKTFSPDTLDAECRRMYESALREAYDLGVNSYQHGDFRLALAVIMAVDKRIAADKTLTDYVKRLHGAKNGEEGSGDYDPEVSSQLACDSLNALKAEDVAFAAFKESLL